MNRRRFTLAAAATLAAAQLPFASSAYAQAIATLKMMIPANPGGGWDQTGRALAAAMQSAKAVGSVQFDNKGGAAGTIGLTQFINAQKGDPNAVLMGGMVMVGGIVLNKSPVNLTMVTPLARLTSEYLVVVVPANSPHKTMADLVAAFKADPGKVSWHGGSAGGSDHILAGLIAKAVGGDPAKVNYVAAKGGGDQVANIVGGHVTAGIAGLGEFAEHIKGGRMRALAVSAPAKQDGVPALKEQGIDVVLGNWRGIFGAPGITTAQRDALVNAVKAGTESAAWKESLAKYGWEPVFLAGDAYKAFVEEDTKRITGILESLGLKK
ncbi:MAG: tripartite tricarboxylate transporter substrate binding protein [Betaproteobacteria bacterium]|nr:tripartite tricarboxylate transporter substrate binding protein [Betaproteobacteria bacterium]